MNDSGVPRPQPAACRPCRGASAPPDGRARARRCPSRPAIVTESTRNGMSSFTICSTVRRFPSRCPSPAGVEQAHVRRAGARGGEIEDAGRRARPSRRRHAARELVLSCPVERRRRPPPARRDLGTPGQRLEDRRPRGRRRAPEGVWRARGGRGISSRRGRVVVVSGTFGARATARAPCGVGTEGRLRWFSGTRMALRVSAARFRCARSPAAGSRWCLRRSR